MADNTVLGLGPDGNADVGTSETISAGTRGTVASQTDIPVQIASLNRGDLIGRFVVLDVLGTGGMGIVYSAYDPHLDRKVAIKLLRAAGANAEDAHARLLREAQAMAKIDHPNVIKVHEVGMYGDQVYVAMEFAERGTVSAWLAQQRRSQREIVDVFVQAGRGLGAAHAAGLVHRDFKPDNLLLAADGTVRVTDFGLVGVLRGDTDVAAAERAVPPDIDMSLSGSTPLSQDLTRTGSIMGTPAYMSPEQFAGAPTSARTDQFAFCVALYEALYGERPFRGSSFQELCANVTLGQLAPIPPGADVPRWLRRVLVRALAVEPSARYDSMDAVRAALLRESMRRRNRILALGAIVAAVAALAAFVVMRPSPGSTCSNGGDRVAKVWNPARRDQIRAAFAASHRSYAAETFGRVAAMLDRWTDEWQAGYLDACEATSARGEQSEHLLDLRMQCLTARLGETDATLALLVQGGDDTVDHAIDAVLNLPTIAGCADAAALTASVAPPANPAIAARVAVVRSPLDAARAMDKLGRYAPARELAQAALANARGAGYPPIVANALYVDGTAGLELGDPAAIDVVREAMHVAAEAGDQGAELDAAARLVKGLTISAQRFDLAREISDLADATAVHAHPGIETMTMLANAHGWLDNSMGHPADARKRYEATLALAEKALGPDSPIVAATIGQLAHVLKGMGKYAEAGQLFERNLATIEKLVGKDHPETASALNELASLYRLDGRLADAKRLLDRALAIRLAALGPDHVAVGESYNSLGTFYSDAGDPTTAVTYYKKALANWEKTYGPDHPQLALTLDNLASTYNALGDLPAARTTYGRALKLYEAAKIADDPRIATVLSNLSTVDRNEGKLDDALAKLHRAQEITTKAYGPESPELADYLANEANVLGAQYKLAEAQTTAQHAAEIAEKAYGPDHVEVGKMLLIVANLQAIQEDNAGALTSYERSLAILEPRLGVDAEATTFALFGVGNTLFELKRPGEAIPYLERALAARIKTKMASSYVADVRYVLATAQYESGASHAEAIRNATTAAAEYDAAHSTANATVVRVWLAHHRK